MERADDSEAQDAQFSAVFVPNVIMFAAMLIAADMAMLITTDNASNVNH